MLNNNKNIFCRMFKSRSIKKCKIMQRMSKIMKYKLTKAKTI